MKRFIITILLLAFAGLSFGAENLPAIIPLPRKVVCKGKIAFTLTESTRILLPRNDKVLRRTAEIFVQTIAREQNLMLKIREKDSGEIRLTVDPQLAEEAYRLDITASGIDIRGGSSAGVFYGLQSFRQLLAQYGTVLPALQIEDAPSFGYRGAMLDCGRHFFTVDEIKTFIDLLALHKINRFHWHLTEDQGWRIEIRRYPELTKIGSQRSETVLGNNSPAYDGTPYGGYYTQDQLRDVVTYAAERFIVIIPEIEMPGHAIAALASYPELSCRPDTTYEVTGTWGVFEEVFCPKEETFQFLEGVLDEVMELFPSSYIHIGGDECPKDAWMKCAHCQGLIKKLGLKDDTTPNAIDGKKHTKEEKLQSYFITRMEKYLNSKGRNIIGWDEILEGGLAPNATVMSWRGVEGGITAAKAGHDAIMTPSPYAYLDQYQEEPETAPTTIGGYQTLKKTYSYNPVPDDADELVTKHIIGVQGNIWNEYMQSDERRDYQAFPRAVALAETGWTQNNRKNWNSFRSRMVEDFERMDAMNVKACRNFFDVNINTHVYDGTLKAVLETFYPDAEIRYTTDGSAPTAKSELYTQPFTWKGYIDLQAAAFKNGKMLGKVNGKKLYANLISGKQYTTTPHWGWMSGDIFGENDILGADTTTLGLTNGKRGNIASFTPWVAFSLNEKNNNELVFSVDLEKPATISKVIFGTLYNPAFRVLPASAARVEVSTDGKEFKEVAQASYTREYPEHGRKMFTDVLEFTPAEARYIKVTLKSGGTLRNGIDCRKDSPGDIIPSDLYVDEIEVY